MDTQNGKLTERYQEFAADFHSRWLITWRNITIYSVIGGVMPVISYTAQEQLANPAFRFAIAAGGLAMTGASLRSAYQSVDHEVLYYAKYRYFKDLAIAQADEPARPQ